MEQATRNLLEKNEINVDKALERLMNNEVLLIDFLKQFTKDKNYSRLKESIEEGEVKKAFDAAHTLKGLSANLELHPILDAVNPIVEQLRSGELNNMEEMLGKLDEAYDKICKMILEL